MVYLSAASMRFRKFYAKFRTNVIFYTNLALISHCCLIEVKNAFELIAVNIYF